MCSTPAWILITLLSSHQDKSTPHPSSIRMLCTHFLLQNWIKRPEMWWVVGRRRSPQLRRSSKCEPEAAVWSPGGVGMKLCGLWEMIVCERLKRRGGGGGREGKGGFLCISRTVTLYQRPFVFSPLRGSSCEPPHDSALVDDHGHMPHWSPTLPSAPLLSSEAAKDKVTTTRPTYRWGDGLTRTFQWVFWASPTRC